MSSFLSAVTSYIQPMSRASIFISIALVTTISLTATIKLFYKRRETRKNAAIVTKLRFYPIKSLPGVSVDQLEVTKSCLKSGELYDR